MTGLLVACVVAAWPCPAAKDVKLVCTEKEPKGCVPSAEALLTSPGCREEALSRYRVACHVKEARACAKLGFRLVEASRDAKTVKEAIALFEKACAGNDAMGCANLATFFWDGEGVPRDVKKAGALFQQACDAGDAFACGSLGAMHAQGELGAKDLPKAAALFKKACDGGSASGCNQLGNATVATSLEGAMTLWAKACKGGYAAACTNLGRAFRKQKDDRNAEKAFARACKLGDSEGCGERDVPPEE
jgi:TPR repeat protein